MTIPKVFHTIWVTTNPMPPAFVQYRADWQKLHPDWRMVLWDDARVADMQMYNRDLYEEATSGAAMCDILCLEILYQFGGVYIDADMEPRKNIDGLLGDEDLIAASEDNVHVSGGFMGATPRHPVFLEMITDIRASIERNANLPLNYRSGPPFRTPHFARHEMTLLPPKLVYPYLWFEPEKANDSFPEAYMVHRWAASWK